MDINNRLNSSKLLSGFVKALSSVEERIDRVLDISSSSTSSSTNATTNGNTNNTSAKANSALSNTATEASIESSAWGNVFEWDGNGITSFIGTTSKSNMSKSVSRNSNLTKVSENISSPTPIEITSSPAPAPDTALASSDVVLTNQSSLESGARGNDLKSNDIAATTNATTNANNNANTDATATANTTIASTPSTAAIDATEQDNFIAVSALSVSEKKTDIPTSAVNRISDDIEPKLSKMDADNTAEAENEKIASEHQKLLDTLKQRESQLMNANIENAKLLEELEKFKSSSIQTSQLPSTQQKLLEDELNSKTHQIEQLTIEGNKLSELNGKLREAAKKLKQKETELSKAVMDLNTKYLNEKNEASVLKEKIIGLEEREKQYQDSLKSKSDSSDQLLNKVKKLEEDLQNKVRQITSVQSLLEKNMEELGVLRKERETNSFNLKSDLLEKQSKANSELQDKLDKLTREFQIEKDSLKKEIIDVRNALSRAENEIGWKEDQHRKEISSYQQRLQEAEASNDEISSSIQEASKPFIRQINAMKQQQAHSQELFEQMEKGMRERIALLEAEKITLQKTIKNLEESLLATDNRLQYAEETALKEKQASQNHLSQLNDEKRAMKELKMKLDLVEEKLNDLTNERYRELNEVKNQVERSLRSQMEEEKNGLVEQVKRLESQIVEKQKEIEKTKSRRYSETKISPSKSEDSKSPSVAQNNTLFDQLQFSGRLSLLENQVSTLRLQLEQTQQQKEQLSSYLIELTKENNSLKDNNRPSNALATEFEELKNRYTATLELLGEKTERVEELTQDISDMKEAYKSQLQDLLLQLSQKQQRS